LQHLKVQLKQQPEDSYAMHCVLYWNVNQKLNLTKLELKPSWYINVELFQSIGILYRTGNDSLVTAN